MATMTCPKCGTPNRPNAKFCAKCRAPLSVPSAGAPVPPPAPPPPPVTPRQPPAPPPPPSPRQPPQAARPAARGRLFTRGRIIGAVIGIMLLCLCVALVVVLREQLLRMALRGSITPTSSLPIATSLPMPVVSSATPRSTAPSVSPTTSAPTPIAVPPLTATIFATPTTKPPSATPTSTPTATQTPTATPSASPTTTVQPTAIPTDTAAGSVLRPGESWRVGTQVMTLQNPRFAGTTCSAILEFEVVFENTDAHEVVVSLRGQEWKVIDEHNQPYETFFWQGTKPTDCNLIAPLATLDKTALAAREKYQVGLQVRGKLADNVNQFQFIATKAGRITDAKWGIKVPR